MPVPTNHKLHRRIISWVTLLPSAPDTSHSTPLPTLLVSCDHLFAFLPSIPSGFLVLPKFDFHPPEEIPHVNLFCSTCHRSAQQIDRVVSRSVYG